MLSAPAGRFLMVNMDRCKDITGRLFEHVTPEMGQMACCILY